MNNKEINDVLSYLDFKNGLLDVVIQDKDSGRVLMLGYMNQEALIKTLNEGEVYFWSRSREELWKKGETSGHTQKVEEMRIDCDGDAILVVVNQKVGACHTGHFSCFYRKIINGEIEVMEEKVFDPENVYGE